MHDLWTTRHLSVWSFDTTPACTHSKRLLLIIHDQHTLTSLNGIQLKERRLPTPCRDMHVSSDFAVDMKAL